MSDKRDAREPASVSVSDGNVNDTLRCPVCEGLHPIKLDRRGNPFVTLSCVGAGSNVFPRTAYGRETFEGWKKAASDVTVSVPDEVSDGDEGDDDDLSAIFNKLREKLG